MNETESTSDIPQQSAKEDISKLANTAKKATEGFEFSKLFEGRLDQTNYLYGVITSVVCALLLMYIPIIGMLASILLGVVGLGMSARRLHDIGTTGWAALLLFIPLVGLLGVIYLCWKIGDVKSNQYGAPPDAKREMFRSWLNT